MNIIITICLSIALMTLIIAIFSFFKLKGLQRLNYLKNFKKGKALVVYLLILPLLWMGLVYSNDSGILDNFFFAVKHVTDLIALKFSTSTINKLMIANSYYSFSIYVFYTLILLNSIIFTFSLFGQWLVNSLRYFMAMKNHDDIYIFVEYNKNNTSIIKSLRGQTIVLFGKLSSEQKEDLFVSKVIYREVNNPKNVRKIVLENFKNLDKRKSHVFINTEDDTENLLYTKQFVQIIDKLELREVEDNGTIINKMDIYAFGMPTNESAFLQFAELTHGCVHHLNKYKLIANDFIDKYPLTHFMDNTIVDYSKGTIRNEYNEEGKLIKDIDLNFIMIGFGKTNQQLFLSSLANDQFITLNAKGEVIPKFVNYYLYDKEEGKESNKMMNHTFNRYLNEVNRIKEKHLVREYLELPPVPAKVFPRVLDVDCSSFIHSIKEVLMDDLKENLEIKKYNYLLISYGTDLENIDLAEKLVQMVKEWGVEDSTKIFVKVRRTTLIEHVVSKERLENKEYYIYSGENDVVYNAKCIMNEKIEKMARMRNELYTLEEYATKTDYELKDYEVEAVKKKALTSWYSRSEIERFSNIFACLSIKSKLNLLGFDYVPIADSKKGVTKEEFDEVYEKGFMKNEVYYKNGKFEKSIVQYDLDFLPSLRTNMAILEHQRWNAYMISAGMIPSSIKEIKENSNNGKDYKLRKHRITTMKGLEEYRKIKAKKNNTTELKEDVIKYDYQILDDVYWLLEKNGYKIIKRGK